MYVAEAPPKFNRWPLEAYGTITSTIGEGTFGTIHATDRDYAIKKISFDDEFPDNTILNEIIYPSSVAHPNIIKYQDVYFDDTSVQLVMPRYADDLKQLPTADRISCFKSIALQLVTAIAYLTSRNILHRDIKPQNIFYNLCDVGAPEEQVQCVLGDFGLAIGRECMLNLDNWNVYTQWYRPPEVFLQLTKYTASAEVWALGCTLYEIYTGNPLFPFFEDELIPMIIEKIGGVTESSILYDEFIHILREGAPDQEIINSMTAQPPPGILVADPVVNDFLLRMLNPDPQLRESIFTLQYHPIFDGMSLITPCQHLSRVEINQCLDRTQLFDRHFKFDIPMKIEQKFLTRMDPGHLTKIISWMLDVKAQIELNDAAYILSVEMLYRYLNLHPVSTSEYQLVAIMALYIAGEFIFPIKIVFAISIYLDGAGYSRENGYAMLQSMVTTLNYDLCATTNHDRLASQKIRYEEPILKLASTFLVLVTPIHHLYSSEQIVNLCLSAALQEYHRPSLLKVREFKTELLLFYSRPDNRELLEKTDKNMYSKLANSIFS